MKEMIENGKINVPARFISTWKYYFLFNYVIYLWSKAGMRCLSFQPGFYSCYCEYRITAISGRV